MCHGTWMVAVLRDGVRKLFLIRGVGKSLQCFVQHQMPIPIENGTLGAVTLGDPHQLLGM